MSRLRRAERRRCSQEEKVDGSGEGGKPDGVLHTSAALRGDGGTCNAEQCSAMNATLCNTMQHHAVQCSAMNATLCSAMQHHAVQCKPCRVLHTSTALRGDGMQCNAEQ